MSPTVTVCRDCCCGSTRKHPGVDHNAHLEALRGGIAGYGRVVVSQCLLACDRSNVMVVTPAPEQRREGAGPAWLAGVLTDELIVVVIEWIREGGPGAAPIPAELAPLRSDRPERGGGLEGRPVPSTCRRRNAGLRPRG